MTEAEYIHQQRLLGWKIHENAGVYWRQKNSFFAQPVFEFRPFSVGFSVPKKIHSLLGYVHQVPDARQANKIVQFMGMSGETIRSYSLNQLDGKKRNKVRQGLKNCAVKAIEDIALHLEEMRQINISQASRLMGDVRFDTAPSAYVKNAEAWKQKMKTLFALPGRKWWGAFVGGKLIAYVVTLHIEDIVFFDTTKTHTEAFRFRPTDALYHTILEYLATDKTCARIMNSQVSRPSLDEFKQQFLFRATPVYYYYSNPNLHKMVANGLMLCKGILSRARRATDTIPVSKKQSAAEE